MLRSLLHIRRPLRLTKTTLSISQTARSQKTSKTCPSCSRALPTALPACPHCAYIAAPPLHWTYHDLFELPYEPNPFRVDARALKERFRRAQAVCHPDAWVSKGSVRFLSHALFPPPHSVFRPNQISHTPYPRTSTAATTRSQARCSAQSTSSACTGTP